MQQDMIYAYTVYLEKSFSKAAEKLFVTQPTLSIAIKRVEASYGAPLFDRSQSPLQLTDAGVAYMETAKRIFSLEEGLACQIQDLSLLRLGKLRVGGTHYVNIMHLAPALRIFSARYPGVEITLREGSSDRVAAMLLNNEIDLMFKVGPVDETLFTATAAFQDKIFLAIAKELPINQELRPYVLTAEMIRHDLHLRPDCPCVPMELLRHTEFLLLAERNNLHQRSLNICHEAGFEPKIKMKMEQLVTAYYLTNYGLGASFVSDWLIKELALGLCYYKIASPEATRDFHAIVRKGQYIPKAVQAFRSIVQTLYQPPGLSEGYGAIFD